MTLDRSGARPDILAIVQDRFRDLVEDDESYRGEAKLTIYIEIPTASQVTRIASTLERVDHAVRRATAAFAPSYDADGYLRLTPSTTSGLIVEAVAISSYHGKHRLQGQSQHWASRHPFQFALLFVFFSGVHDAYVLPHYPFTGDEACPPAIAPRSPRHHVEVDIDTTISLTELEPPTAGGGGAPAEITVVIEGPDGRTAITFTSVPRPPRVRQ